MMNLLLLRGFITEWCYTG